MKHSRLPWNLEHGTVKTADGTCVAMNVKSEDGKLIVLACNNHGRMREVIKIVRAMRRENKKALRQPATSSAGDIWRSASDRAKSEVLDAVLQILISKVRT